MADVMVHKEWPPARTPEALGQTSANPRVEANLRRAIMMLNLLIKEYNALLASYLAYSGSALIDTVGTIGTGVWEGDPIADAYIASAATWDAKQDALTFDTYSVINVADVIGLQGDLVSPGNDYFYGTDEFGAKGWQDLALVMSTWVGSVSIVTVGTIATGTWEADVIDHERGGLEIDVSGYNGLVKISGGVTAVVPIGIDNGYIPPIAVAGVVDNDYAKFTGTGLEGRSYAEVLVDLGVVFGIDNGNVPAVTVGGVLEDDYAKFTATGLAGRSYTEVRSDLGLFFGIDNGYIPPIAVAGVVDNDYAKFTGTGLEGRSYAEVLVDLGLGNVEDTALSTWAGSGNITTVGTIGTGVWQGTVIDAAYLGLTFQKSLDESAGAVELDGDVATPGANMYYGTNAAGQRGWHILPVSSIPSGGPNQILGMNSDGSDFEFKILQSTPNRVSVNHQPGQIVFATPQNLGTNSTVRFGRIGAGTAASSVYPLSLSGPIRMD